MSRGRFPEGCVLWAVAKLCDVGRALCARSFSPGAYLFRPLQRAWEVRSP